MAIFGRDRLIADMSNVITIADHVLYEDEYILVLHKPAGLMVEPDRNGHPNLLHQVRAYLKSAVAHGEEVYAQHIHRLDRPVSGVVLFAKQRAVLKNLSEQFAERRVKKFYQALTANAPLIRKETLTNWLRKEKKKAVIYEQEIEFSEKVILDYTITDLSEGRYLWDVELYTGKYHQIRAQLAYLGCPVVGDQVYGSAIPYQPDSIALYARRLIFFHPVTNVEMSISGPEHDWLS
jgi:23S rRNA-/tRNA-specific pseudouridylate synthase